MEKPPRAPAAEPSIAGAQDLLERRRAEARRYLEGASTTEIAHEFGLKSHKTVCRDLAALGIERRPRPAKGVPRPADVRAKISAANTGKPRPDLVELMRARMTRYPAEERSCESCGQSLGTILGWVLRRGGGKFCARCVATGAMQRWLWENVRGGRQGRVVSCKCGRTTRYLSPSQLKIAHCKFCYASDPAVRERKSAAVQRAMRRPATKLKVRLARWGKVGNHYFARAWEEFERRRRGGAPRKTEFHGRLRRLWLKLQDEAADEQPSRLIADVALRDWQEHPEDWPRDRYPASRHDPDDFADWRVRRVARDRVRKAL